MNDTERWNTALMIAIEDLEVPNSDTRRKAIDRGCFVEFMEIRQRLIEYAHNSMYQSSSLDQNN